MTTFTRSLSVADVGPCYAPALTTDEHFITMPEGETSVTYTAFQAAVRPASGFAICIPDGVTFGNVKTPDEAIAEGLIVGVKNIVDGVSYDLILQTDSRSSGMFCVRVTVINGGLENVGNHSRWPVARDWLH